ncbi:Photosystem II 12 kDa extrinsic protein [Halomicronema hongdechloris C2206]|uniref:Photosystem II 12 kDa extrinsic protein n=1 Tax=Halomicronema hongdechloris C2206 TaxID=1641165 RepID=A0A1Z3HHP2_9CYAN|nr:helix-hairpin-helix domain-containing protein [Halomicronema hongdechloris]ASC69814.1 Photosystem II 12 kDa extrinsic protein [Halomicronema hongdechloris C2206]
MNLLLDLLRTIGQWLQGLLAEGQSPAWIGGASVDQPYQRFRSLAEVQRAAQRGTRIDVNQATLDDWLRLPTISIHQARVLVQLRQAGVPFYSLEDVAAALNLPLHALYPIAPILQFCYYNSERLESAPRLSLNQGTVAQFSQIPGCSMSLAGAIVRERQRGGSYRSHADFQQRLGISPGLMAHLLHYLRP